MLDFNSDETKFEAIAKERSTADTNPFQIYSIFLPVV